jgi:hypothetical protein
MFGEISGPGKSVLLEGHKNATFRRIAVQARILDSTWLKIVIKFYKGG